MVKSLKSKTSQKYEEWAKFEIPYSVLIPSCSECLLKNVSIWPGNLINTTMKENKDILRSFAVIQSDQQFLAARDTHIHIVANHNIVMKQQTKKLFLSTNSICRCIMFCSKYFRRFTTQNVNLSQFSFWYTACATFNNPAWPLRDLEVFFTWDV